MLLEFLMLMIVALPGIRDSLNFRHSGSWPFSVDHAIEEDSSRNLLFAASGTGVLVLDESQPDTFLLVSSKIRINGDYIKDLAYDIENQVLFTAHRNAMISVWSVADPTNPSLIATFQDTFSYYSPVNKLILHGDYLFAAFGNSSGNYIRVFDKNDPGFTPVATINIPHDTIDMVIVDTLLYVSAEPNLRIYSIGDPSNPQILGSHYLGWGDYVLGARGNLLFRGRSRSYLYIDDITDPLNPVQVSVVRISPIQVNRILCQGDTLFIAGTSLMSLDITDPANPETLWIFRLTEGGVLGDIIVHEDRIISTTGGDGICSLEFDENGIPYESNFYQTPAMAVSVAYDGMFYFITDNAVKTFLHILDVDEELTEIARMEFSGIPDVDLQVENGLLYFFADTLLRIVDVSDPENPYLRSSFYPVSPPRERHFVVEDGFLFTTDSIGGLWIVSVENPDSPFVVSHVRDSFEYEGNLILADSGYVYLAGRYYLHVVNVTNPDSPVVERLMRIDDATFFAAMKKVGDLLYLFNQDSTLFLVDVSDPSSPAVDTVIYLPSYAIYTKSVDREGDRIVARTNRGWIYLLDVSDPSAPVVSGYYRVPTDYIEGLVDVVLSGNLVTSISFLRGLHLYEITPTGIAEKPMEAASTGRLVVRNTVWFERSGDGPVSLKVYDPSGRLRAFMRKSPPESRVSFDLSRLPSGFYLYIFESGSTRKTGRIVKVDR